MGSCTPKSLSQEQSSSINLVKVPSQKQRLSSETATEVMKENRKPDRKNTGKITLVKKPTVVDSTLFHRWNDPNYTGDELFMKINYDNLFIKRPESHIQSIRK